MKIYICLIDVDNDPFVSINLIIFSSIEKAEKAGFAKARLKEVDLDKDFVQISSGRFE